MKTGADLLALRYRMAHNEMRSIDGLQPAEALDELLKYLLVKTEDEAHNTAPPKLDGFSSNRQRAAAAKHLRVRLTDCLDHFGQYAMQLFHSKDFRLSDPCLAKVHEILGHERLTESSFDVRSTALRSFLNPKLRKGLGIFLTPDQIVDEVVDFCDFPANAVVADPACGSGTFLMSAASKALKTTTPIHLYGIDKSPRMMLLADLNLGPSPPVAFNKRICDTLRPEEYTDFLCDESVDIILTNPPFGVNVDSRTYDLSIFATAATDGAQVIRRQPSELLFLEQCLSLLKPDGLLAIVLPRSAVNTLAADRARSMLSHTASVLAIITLPPETFGSTGTMTNTVVLFLRKYGSLIAPSDDVQPAVARIDNVGFDSTGRVREGSQLPGLGRALRAACFGTVTDDRITRGLSRRAEQTLPSLPEIVKGQKQSSQITHRRTLGDLVTFAATGTTPPRAAYADSGLFLVKVGNLTGAGVSWVPRDRNFVDGNTAAKRRTRPERLLQAGDIVLTSSAHSPKYIARKVDVIDGIPEWVGGIASFVGEITVLRPDERSVDPFVLAAYLRLPMVTEEIQYMVRGQTAHLHPVDLLSLQIDEEMIRNELLVTKLAVSVRREAKLNLQMNDIAWDQIRMRASLLERTNSR